MAMGKRENQRWVDRDVGSRHWRRVLCMMQNHSGAAKIKRGIRRRERRQARQQLRKESEDV